VPDSLFAVDARSGVTVFTPTEHARGPWGPDLLHGGAVAALLAHELVAEGAAGGDLQRWFPARFTADFPRPLPMAAMAIEATIVRAGRKARIIDAALRVDGVLVARATLQQVRVAEVPVDDDNPAAAWTGAPVEQPEEVPVASPASSTGTAFHSSSVEHRSRGGLLVEANGPGRDWIRVRTALLPGVALSPFERTVATADFGNGVSASMPFDRYTFVNADLTVHLFRLPVDEWVLLDAVTWVADQGVGLAESALLDRRGLIGRACQSLVIATR